jgi:hypothetical protein
VSVGNGDVIALGIVAVAAVVGWFPSRRHEPEDAASHDAADRTGFALYDGDVNDRPAGPDAETDDGATPAPQTQAAAAATLHELERAGVPPACGIPVSSARVA